MGQVKYFIPQQFFSLQLFRSSSHGIGYMTQVLTISFRKVTLGIRNGLFIILCNFTAGSKISHPNDPICCLFFLHSFAGKFSFSVPRKNYKTTNNEEYWTDIYRWQISNDRKRFDHSMISQNLKKSCVSWTTFVILTGKKIIALAFRSPSTDLVNYSELFV